MRHYYFLPLAAMLALSGCGGGSSQTGGTSGGLETSRPVDQGPITLQPDRLYVVYPGDRIVKMSENAQIAVTHVDGEERSTVRLISGEVQLIRG